MYANPAPTTWIAYRIGATNKNVNSSGSVIPVKILVKAADSNKPPTTLRFSGFAARYIAKAAPGRPKIMSGNLPAMKRVASVLNTVVDGFANSAKKIFCAPSTI